VTPTIVNTALRMVNDLPIADGLRPKRRCQYRSLMTAGVGDDRSSSPRASNRPAAGSTPSTA
jgi:hypothetical protein